jgi:hypothetical protein
MSDYKHPYKRANVQMDRSTQIKKFLKTAHSYDKMQKNRFWDVKFLGIDAPHTQNLGKTIIFGKFRANLRFTFHICLIQDGV